MGWAAKLWFMLNYEFISVLRCCAGLGIDPWHTHVPQWYAASEDRMPHDPFPLTPAGPPNPPPYHRPTHPPGNDAGCRSGGEGWVPLVQPRPLSMTDQTDTRAPRPSEEGV